VYTQSASGRPRLRAESTNVAQKRTFISIPSSAAPSGIDTAAAACVVERLLQYRALGCLGFTFHRIVTHEMESRIGVRDAGAAPLVDASAAASIVKSVLVFLAGEILNGRTLRDVSRFVMDPSHAWVRAIASNPGVRMIADVRAVAFVSAPVQLQA
jgi:hypothetical protein